MAWRRGSIAVLLAVALSAATVRAQQPAATPPPPAAAAPPAPASGPWEGQQPAPYGGPPPAYPPPPGYAPAPYGAPPAYGYGYGAPAYGAPTPMQLMAFESQKKSAPLALVLEFFIFPGIGSIYADHAQGALITWAGIGGGIALVIVGATRLEHTVYDPNGQTTSTTGNDQQAGTFILIGALAILAGRIYGLVDSWQSANAYNVGLARRIGLPAMAATVAPLRTDRGLAWGPAFQLRF